jgi:hypothetical protein
MQGERAGALAAGPRVLARRARVLESLARVVDGGRANAKAPARLPGLVAEGVVGATFGVIHARLLELRPEPLTELLGQLMATIVLPYRGSEAAARELTRPVPRSPIKRRDGDGLSRRPLGAASPVDYRLTVRTQMALAAVSGRPGLNNREVSELVGLSDQGQISRMMKRLQPRQPRDRSGRRGQGRGPDLKAPRAPADLWSDREHGRPGQGRQRLASHTAGATERAHRDLTVSAGRIAIEKTSSEGRFSPSEAPSDAEDLQTSMVVRGVSSA